MFVVETEVLTLVMQKPIIGCESEPFSSTTHPQKSFSCYSPSCFLLTQIWKQPLFESFFIKILYAFLVSYVWSICTAYCNVSHFTTLTLLEVCVNHKHKMKINTLVMETELVSKTFMYLMQLSAREDWIEFCHCENVKIYQKYPFYTDDMVAFLVSITVHNS